MNREDITDKKYMLELTGAQLFVILNDIEFWTDDHNNTNSLENRVMDTRKLIAAKVRGVLTK